MISALRCVKSLKTLTAACSRTTSRPRDELCRQIGYTGSTTANIETMYRAPTPDQARRLGVAFGLSGIFERIEERLHGVPFSAGFRPFQLYEGEAVELRLFQHTLLPGLLHTEDSVRAVVSTHQNATAEEISERVAGRLKRQVVLDWSAPVIWVLLDENAFRREIGSTRRSCMNCSCT